MFVTEWAYGRPMSDQRYQVTVSLTVEVTDPGALDAISAIVGGVDDGDDPMLGDLRSVVGEGIARLPALSGQYGVRVVTADSSVEPV